MQLKIMQPFYGNPPDLDDNYLALINIWHSVHFNPPGIIACSCCGVSCTVSFGAIGGSHFLFFWRVPPAASITSSHFLFFWAFITGKASLGRSMI